MPGDRQALARQMWTAEDLSRRGDRLGCYGRLDLWRGVAFEKVKSQDWLAKVCKPDMQGN